MIMQKHPKISLFIITPIIFTVLWIKRRLAAHLIQVIDILVLQDLFLLKFL